MCVAKMNFHQPQVEHGRRINHQVGLKRQGLAAQRLEPLKRAVSGDGEVEHLVAPGRRDAPPPAVLVEPFLEPWL